MNFKPLGKRVLVQRTQVEEKTASGIILVDSAKEKPNTAKVVAVSSEVSELKVDDVIVFEAFRGTEISLEGEDYLVLELENIIGIM